MSAKFKFYEVVKVQSERAALREIVEASGAVLGMDQNDDGEWIYAVHMFDTEESWDIRESELLPTGKFMKREDFYSGDSVTVEVNRETGEGKIKSN